MTQAAYSNELYDTIADFGLRRGSSILDVRAGDKDASAPFSANGFNVTHVDASESARLPFPDERFDVAVSAGPGAWPDRMRALLEMHRVLRRGGIVAIWWKVPMGESGAPRGEGLTGGFKEFYAAPFLGQTLRVLPWRTASGAYIQYLYLARK